MSRSLAYENLILIKQTYSAYKNKVAAPTNIDIVKLRNKRNDYEIVNINKKLRITEIVINIFALIYAKWEYSNITSY